MHLFFSNFVYVYAGKLLYTNSWHRQRTAFYFMLYMKGISPSELMCSYKVYFCRCLQSRHNACCPSVPVSHHLSPLTREKLNCRGNPNILCAHTRGRLPGSVFSGHTHSRVYNTNVSSHDAAASLQHGEETAILSLIRLRANWLAIILLLKWLFFSALSPRPSLHSLQDCIGENFTSK